MGLCVKAEDIAMYAGFCNGRSNEMARMSNTFVALTYIYNIARQPAMSVSLFWSEDSVPVGVQFAARFGDEARLFHLVEEKDMNLRSESSPH
jgi:Asp-tRNA(Asn)/Glu-tRNA(Gln) amidotransferase A subunit family amidase